MVTPTTDLIEKMSLWVKLTTQSPSKHGLAITGRLKGEVQTAAKPLSTEAICRESGADLILQRLDKAYEIGSHLFEEGSTVLGRRRSGGRPRGNHQHRNGSVPTWIKPMFYLFRTSCTQQGRRVIVDSGACKNVVGKNTLEKAMRSINLQKVDDTDISQKTHRFGNNNDNQPTLFAIKMTFQSKEANAVISV